MSQLSTLGHLVPPFMIKIYAQLPEKDGKKPAPVELLVPAMPRAEDTLKMRDGVLLRRRPYLFHTD